MGHLLADWATTGAIAVALATAASLLARTGVLSLGHGVGLFAGAYAAAGCWLATSMSGAGALLLGMALGAAAGAASGGVLGLASVRVNGDGMLVISLLLTEVARGMASGAGAFGGTIGRAVPVAGVPREAASLAASLGVVALVAAVAFGLSRTRAGAASDAIRHDPLGAALSGLPVARLRVAYSVLLGAVAGLAGATCVLRLGRVTPDLFDLPWIILLFATGLVGSTRGAPTAAGLALLLVAVPEALRIVPFQVPVALGGVRELDGTELWPFAVAAVVAVGGHVASLPGRPR